MNQIEQVFRSNLYLATVRGWDPWLVYTQAALETQTKDGYFTSPLAHLNNYFGIKPWPAWIKNGGKVINKNSPEVTPSGETIHVNSDFILPPTPDIGILILLRLIGKYHPLTYSTRLPGRYTEYFHHLRTWSTAGEQYEKDNIALYEKFRNQGNVFRNE